MSSRKCSAVLYAACTSECARANLWSSSFFCALVLENLVTNPSPARRSNFLIGRCNLLLIIRQGGLASQDAATRVRVLSGSKSGVGAFPDSTKARLPPLAFIYEDFMRGINLKFGLRQGVGTRVVPISGCRRINRARRQVDRSSRKLKRS